MDFIMLVVSILPIMLPLIFLVFLAMPAKKAMPLSSVIFIICTMLVWQLEMSVVFASIVQGFHQALTIILILLGSLTLLNTLKTTGAVTRINIMFSSISTDMRVQAVMLAWLFGSLIEGAAGFGTPAAVIGPLMVLLGFNPLAAASLALIGDSIAVSFGAISTPISVGLNGLVDPSQMTVIGQKVAIMDLMVGAFLPLIIIFILTQVFSNQKRDIKDFVVMIPWGLLIGFTYVLTSIFATSFLGNEFVSIISPIVAMIVAAFTASKGILLPKDKWRKAQTDIVMETKSDLSLLKTWAPYIAVICLLLITRLVPSIQTFMQKNILTNLFSMESIFGTDISSTWEILYSPGTILIVAAILASLIQSSNLKAFTQGFSSASKSLNTALIALCGTLSMVYLFRNSGIGVETSMPVYIANSLSLFENVWYMFAPFLGILGSFITGSATVSALTFSPIQASVASTAGLDTNIILAQQIAGGAIGNMICVHNVVAAATVVGLEGSEGKIIKIAVIPALLLGTLSVIAGSVLIFL